MRRGMHAHDDENVARDRRISSTTYVATISHLPEAMRQYSDKRHKAALLRRSTTGRHDEMAIKTTKPSFYKRRWRILKLLYRPGRHFR